LQSGYDIKEEGFILLMVSEVLVHGCLAPLILGCGKAEYYDGDGTVQQRQK
jgi:hypothetical protein